MWKLYDENASQFIALTDIPSFLMELGELHGGVVGSYGVNRLQQLLDALQLQNYGGLVNFNDCLCAVHLLEYSDTLAKLPDKLKNVSSQVTETLISSTQKRIKIFTRGKDPTKVTPRSNVRRAKLERLIAASESEGWKEASRIAANTKKRLEARIRRKVTGVVEHVEQKNGDGEDGGADAMESVRTLECNAALSVFAKMNVVAKLLEKKRRPVDLRTVGGPLSLVKPLKPQWTLSRTGNNSDQTINLAAQRLRHSHSSDPETQGALSLPAAVAFKRLLAQARGRRQKGVDPGGESSPGGEDGTARAGGRHQARTEARDNNPKILRIFSSSEKRRSLAVHIRKQ